MYHFRSFEGSHFFFWADLFRSGAIPPTARRGHFFRGSLRCRVVARGRCQRVPGERCPGTSYEPLVDRRPRLPAKHAVLTRLVVADGSGGPTMCEPAVEQRHRARVRSADEADTAGSFTRRSCEGRTELPKEILRRDRRCITAPLRIRIGRAVRDYSASCSLSFIR